MRFKSLFTLYKRETKEVRVWCVSYYDAQGQRVRKSTGETTKPLEPGSSYPSRVHQDVLRVG